MQQLIEEQVAREEINSWLDYKRVSDSIREENSESIDTLVRAVQYGELEYDSEEHTLTQKLIEPIGETHELTYKPRVKQGEIMRAMTAAKIKAGDGDGRIACYAAATTGKPLGVIKSMITEDFSVAMAIALFFIQR